MPCPSVELVTAGADMGVGALRRIVSGSTYRAPELHQVVSGRVRVIEKARGGGEVYRQRPWRSGQLAIGFPTLGQLLTESRALLAAAWAQTNLGYLPGRT